MNLQPGITSMAAYRWVVLLFAVLTYATSQFARQNYTGVQKFIVADFGLDTAALGLLGSVFFYAYALFQLPWGIASDRFGSRGIAGVGILLTAAAMAGFATSQSEAALLFWRVAAGVAGAAAYVAVAGALARWFPPNERGLSQGLLGGLGGALGESVAFFLLPVLSIYFASGWRNATSMMAVAIAAIGLVSLAFLRSAPPRTQATTRHPFTRDMLPDALLWCYAALFCAQVIAMRTAQAWIALYCTDVYITAYGYDVNGAAVAGGFLAMVVYSLLGRGVGVPLSGSVSDALARRGVSRIAMVIACLVVAIVSFQVLSMRVTAIWLIGLVAFLLAPAANSFPLITASISETYGPQKTASVFAFINTLGQIVGATVLAFSGYLGVAMSGGDRTALREYQGIWLSAVGAVGLMTMVGAVIYVAGRRQFATRRAAFAST
jgi:MFS family permease